MRKVNIGESYIQAVKEATEVARQEVGDLALSLLDPTITLVGIKYDSETVLLQSKHKAIKTEMLSSVDDKETVRLIKSTPTTFFKNAIIKHFKEEFSLDVSIGSKTGMLFVQSDRKEEAEKRGEKSTRSINNSRMGVIVRLQDLEGSSVNYRLVDTVEEFDKGAF
jgi:hypothetical protein